MKKAKLLSLCTAAMLLLAGCQSNASPSTETAAQQTIAETEETTQESTSEKESGASTDASADKTETDEILENDGSEETAEAPGTDGDEITLRLGVPKAPPTLAILRMIDAKLLGDHVNFELDVWDAPEQLLAMVQDGDHDMFAFPLTVVAKLYNKGLPVRLTNVNTWGVTYFLTTDPDLTEWSQLKGKTVYIPLQSSPPDALTQFFLSEAGLTVSEDVEIIYSTTPEISQLLSAGTIEYATQIEPQVTAAMMNNPDVRIAFSFEDEWKKIRGEESIVPNAGFGTTQAFIDGHPELVAQFEQAYEEALNWVLENPDQAGELAEEHLGLKKALVEKAVPNMGLIYKRSIDAKDDLDGFYQLLNDYDPTMIGGEIPDEGMYYTE